jgi:hypothetical protein
MQQTPFSRLGSGWPLQLGGIDVDAKDFPYLGILNEAQPVLDLYIVGLEHGQNQSAF